MVPSSRPFGETFCRSSGSSLGGPPSRRLTDSGTGFWTARQRDSQLRDSSGLAPDSLLMPGAESQAATKRGKDKSMIE